MKRIKEQHAAEFCGREPNSDKLETKHLEITPSRIANLRASTLEAEQINSLEGMKARRRSSICCQWKRDQRKNAEEFTHVHPHSVITRISHHNTEAQCPHC